MLRVKTFRVYIKNPNLFSVELELGILNTTTTTTKYPMCSDMRYLTILYHGVVEEEERNIAFFSSSFYIVVIFVNVIISKLFD